MMIEWMIKLLNMSFAAGCTVLMVLMLRLFLKKLPKVYSYALWFVVLFRFLCPVTIPAAYSLLPVHAEPVPQQIVYEQIPAVETGVSWLDGALNQVLEETHAVTVPAASANPIQITLFLLGVVWQAGLISFALYYLFVYLRLRHMLSTAIQVEPGVWESDRINGAFVVGVFRPAIYLPRGLEEENRCYILAHETVHIRRRDYLVKLLGLSAVMIHWFNPLSWLSFRLLCRDMEMACDEKVIKTLGQEEKKSYSLALLWAAKQQSGLLFPPAFGECVTRSRIKHILNYRKPGFWISATGAVILVTAGAGLMVSPVLQADEEAADAPLHIIGGADGPTSIFFAGKGDSKHIQMPDSSWLLATRIYKTAPGEEDGRITIDAAMEDLLAFHGNFGMFVFMKDSGVWKQQTFFPAEDSEAIQALSEAFQSMNRQGNGEKERIHKEDRLIGTPAPGAEAKPQVLEFAITRMGEDNIALLGGYADEEGSGRLIDLFYGYYHPAKQVLHQVYLFTGDGNTITNPKGEITVRSTLIP